MQSCICAQIREQIVTEALRAELHQFSRRMEVYREELELYNTKMKTETLRIGLLRDAGLVAECRHAKPAKPRMMAMLAPAKIRAIVANGIRLLEKRNREEHAARWAREVAAHGQGGHPSPRPGTSAFSPRPGSHHPSSPRSRLGLSPRLASSRVVRKEPSGKSNFMPSKTEL